MATVLRVVNRGVLGSMHFLDEWIDTTSQPAVWAEAIGDAQMAAVNLWLGC
jgi:hypothetical protein